MATIEQPSPALHAAVQRTLLGADPWSQSLSTTMSGLAEHLTAEEADCLPEAIAGVLPTFRTDPERLHFAADIAVRLDLFEVADVLAVLAAGAGDRRLMLAAAMLCGNPAVGRQLRQRVADVVGDDPVGQIRLDRRVAPTTADETRLHLQRWPGARAEPARFALAPVVVLDSGFRADAALRLAVRLVAAGTTVRRLTPEAEVPFWFGAQTVLVCRPPTRIRVRSSYPKFPEAQILVQEEIPSVDRDVGRLLRQIDAALPEAQRLRLTALGPQLATRLWDPAVFTAGVYSLSEAAVLTGATEASLRYLLDKGLVTPLGTRRGPVRLTFRDVVAVRTWTYLKSMSRRRISSSVVAELIKFAGDPDAVSLGVGYGIGPPEKIGHVPANSETIGLAAMAGGRVPAEADRRGGQRHRGVQLGATSGGRVLVDRGDGWVDVETGQTHFDLPLTDIDDVFRPFDYGGGTTIDLLQASPNTRLNPTVLHGSPYLNGHRISAKALAGLFRHGGYPSITETYAELEGVAVDDTVLVGLDFLKAA